LLEMLIAVAIFSGLVIMILGIFIRTTSSSARVNVLREKSEAARSAISRITNDFRYIYYDSPITLGDPANQNHRFTGYYFIKAAGFDDLVMVLRYPGATDQQLVVKRYSTTSDSLLPQSRSLTVREWRDCQLENISGVPTMFIGNCANYDSTAYQAVLGDQFVLDNDISKPIFSGVEPGNTGFSTTPYLRIALNLKPVDYADTLCDEDGVPLGSCYKVETSLGAGGLR
jgi:type II secretory pathway pseudopilin PulG